MIHYAKIILCVLFILVSKVNAQSCNDLKANFRTHDIAYNTLQKITFNVNERYDSFLSSWIKSFQYMSCDRRKGYLVMQTKKGQMYIHQNVSIKIWTALKRASSKGTFYSNHLRGKYTLKLG